MKFKELFGDVEDWFWKLEFNPEVGSYELYLGIPNDWVYGQKSNEITIELVHQFNDNSIIKITSTTEELTIDDIIETAKIIVSKNMELEKRKEEHRLEMEKLKDILIEKQKNFLEFIDQVKEDTLTKEVKIDIETPLLKEEETKKENIEVLVGENDIEEGPRKKEDFIKDIEKLNLK